MYQQQSTDESWEKSDDDGSAEVMKITKKMLQNSFLLNTARLLNRGSARRVTARCENNVLCSLYSNVTDQPDRISTSIIAHHKHVLVVVHTRASGS